MVTYPSGSTLNVVKPAVASSTENPAPPTRLRMSLRFSKTIVTPVAPSGKILILCGPTITSYHGLPVVPRA